MSVGHIDIQAFEAFVQQEADRRITKKYVHARELSADLYETEYPQGQTHEGFGERIVFHPGELTVWSGAAGSGKSSLVGQYVAWSGKPSLICSFEMPMRTTIQRIARQVHHGDPTQEQYERWAEQTDIYLYDHIDVLDADIVFNICRFSAEKKGIRQIVIDSLTKLNMPQDGAGFLSEQARFMNDLQAIVKDLQLELHLVAHPRKPADKEQRPDMYSIRGAAQITDLADRVLVLRRNWVKQRIMDLDPYTMDDDEMAEFEEKKKEPDAWLLCEKQRFDGYVGEVPLSYHVRSTQYIPHGQAQALNWREQ